MPEKTPSLDQHINRITSRLQDQQRNIGYTGVFEAYLGKGDGSSTIMAPTGSFPIRQVYYHYFNSDNEKTVSLAPLGDGCDIYYEDNAKYVGVPVKVGYPPKQLGGNVPTIFGVSGQSGQGAAGNQSFFEQKINQIANQLTLSTTDGVISGSGITNINVPPGWLIVNANVATITPPTGSSGGGGGGVATPSILPLLTCNTLLNYQVSTDFTPIAGYQTVNFDQLVSAQNVIGTPVTTGASWHFTAPITADYYVGYSIAYVPTSTTVASQMNFQMLTTGGYIQNTQNFTNTLTLYSFSGQKVVRLNAGGTLYLQLNPVANISKIQGGSAIEIGWNAVIPSSGSPTVVRTVITSGSTTFVTTPICNLPANAAIYDVRIVPPANPGTLQTTIGTTGGTSTDVTLSTDSDLSVGSLNFIPAYYLNSGSTVKVINAYFSGLAGAINQTVTYIVSYI